MKPNLGRPMRIGYLLIGVLLLIAPLLLTLPSWIRIGAPIMGFFAILNSATGW